MLVEDEQGGTVGAWGNFDYRKERGRRGRNMITRDFALV
jgi:hypothetical protein